MIIAKGSTFTHGHEFLPIFIFLFSSDNPLKRKLEDQSVQNWFTFNVSISFDLIDLFLFCFFFVCFGHIYFSRQKIGILIAIFPATICCNYTKFANYGRVRPMIIVRIYQLPNNITLFLSWLQFSIKPKFSKKKSVIFLANRKKLLLLYLATRKRL